MNGSILLFIASQISMSRIRFGSLFRIDSTVVLTLIVIDLLAMLIVCK